MSTAVAKGNTVYLWGHFRPSSQGRKGKKSRLENGKASISPSFLERERLENSRNQSCPKINLTFLLLSELLHQTVRTSGHHQACECFCPSGEGNSPHKRSTMS